MPTDAKRRKLRALLADDQDAQHQRYTDLCLVVELPDGSTLYVAGGRWDAEEERYADAEPEVCKVIRLEPGQVAAFHQLCWWLQERREGRPRDFFSLWLMGDRGAGKTWIAAKGMLLLTLEAPKFGISKSIGWMASKSYELRDELDRELRDAAPAQWYRYREEDLTYTFPTGGKITNVSGNDPESLRNGRVDWLVCNELQKFSHRAYLNGIKRLSDKGGFSILTGNWPHGKSGSWVHDLAEKRKEALDAGRTYPVRLVQLKKAGNRTLDAATESQIDVIFRDLDPRMAATDLDGIALPVGGDRAYWEWDKVRNLRRPPASQTDSIVRNITREITARKTHRRAGFDFVVGLDFQKRDGMWAIIHEIYGLPEAPVLWAVDEIVITGTEEDLIAELLHNGYAPENSLMIGDGSGRWQDGAHVLGRASFKIFKDARYICAGPVPQKDDEHKPRNPLFDDRCRLVNWALKNGRYVVDPVGAPILGEALAKCELRAGEYGQGRPRRPWSHPTDAAGYAAMWLYGEKIRKPTPGRYYEKLPSIYADKYRIS